MSELFDYTFLHNLSVLTLSLYTANDRSDLIWEAKNSTSEEPTRQHSTLKITQEIASNVCGRTTDTGFQWVLATPHSTQWLAGPLRVYMCFNHFWLTRFVPAICNIYSYIHINRFRYTDLRRQRNRLTQPHSFLLDGI